MTKRKNLFSFAGTLLLTVAAVASNSSSSFLFGEVKPPKKQ
ncbi:AgrD family cyclic lactone autoinducer peptide [Fusibacter sp. JL298sf-3]